MTFETKDSGKREQFASGMQRDTQEGKTLWHLIMSGPMVRRWAELLTRGAVKYEPDNWLKAEGDEEARRFKASAFRHFMQWYSGETDEDHAAAVYFNINGYEYVKERGSQLPAGPADVEEARWMENEFGQRHMYLPYLCEQGECKPYRSK